MKALFLVLLICLSSGCIFAQNTDAPNDKIPLFTIGDDDCGDPAYESQIYDNRKGRIVKILSANKVLFEQTSVNGSNVEGLFTVKLFGIDSTQNREAVKDRLKGLLLNQKVEISGNLEKKTDRKFGGIVWVFDAKEGIPEVNIYLLEKGIAKYEPFESGYLVSMVMPCRLQKAEGNAREAKLGIWAK